METELELKWIALIIIVFVSAIVFLWQLDNITGGAIRRAVAGALFWIPFGPIFSSLTQGMSAIPG